MSRCRECGSSEKYRCGFCNAIVCKGCQPRCSCDYASREVRPTDEEIEKGYEWLYAREKEREEKERQEGGESGL